MLRARKTEAYLSDGMKPTNQVFYAYILTFLWVKKKLHTCLDTSVEAIEDVSACWLALAIVSR